VLLKKRTITAITCFSCSKPGFYPGTFWGQLPQTSELPPRSFGQVYSSIKNRANAVIKALQSFKCHRPHNSLSFTISLLAIIITTLRWLGLQFAYR